MKYSKIKRSSWDIETVPIGDLLPPGLSQKPASQKPLITDKVELTKIVKDAIVEVYGANPQQEIYSRKEAAAFLRMKVSTLDKLVKRGRIHPNVATRNPRYSRDELLRFQREDTAKLD